MTKSANRLQVPLIYQVTIRHVDGYWNIIKNMVVLAGFLVFNSPGVEVFSLVTWKTKILK